MNVKAECLCRDHAIEFDWEEGESYITIGFWTRTRNWMDLWTRIKMAFIVLFHGSAMIDDVQIASPQRARDIANLLQTYAAITDQNMTDLEDRVSVEFLEALEAKGELGEQGMEVLRKKHEDSAVSAPVMAGMQRAVETESQVDPAQVVGEYLSKGFTRKPLPKD